MIKHNICHIHCLDHPSVYKTVSNLAKYNDLFTGVKIATITKVTTELKVFTFVKSILEKLGYEVVVVSNDDNREVNHFFSTSLPMLLNKTSDGLLFYNHSKGVIYHPDSEDGKVTSLWTDVLYHYCLTEHSAMPFESDAYDVYGTCRVNKVNFLPDKIGEKFTYVGTFFWIKVSCLKNKTFKPHSKFFLEGLPGLVTTVGRSFNQGPELLSTEGPYNIETWNKKGIYYGFPDKN